MKTITSIKILLTVALLIPILSSAQQGTGLYTQGNSTNIRVMNVEPVCWVNEANGVNAYIINKDGVEIITLQSKGKLNVGKLPKINRVSYSSHGFMLHGENGTGYFFGLGELESKQMLDIMKNTVKGEVKTFDGYGVARHIWPAAKAPKLEELQAANSIYDVLGK